MRKISCGLCFAALGLLLSAWTDNPGVVESDATRREQISDPIGTPPETPADAFHEISADSGRTQTRPLRSSCSRGALVQLTRDTTGDASPPVKKGGADPIVQLWDCPLSLIADEFWTRDSGSIEIDATDGTAECTYARQDGGSWIAQQFTAGQHVLVSGYATNPGNNGWKRVKSLTAQNLVTEGDCVTENETGGDRIIGALDTDTCGLVCSAATGCEFSGDEAVGDEGFYDIHAHLIAARVTTPAAVAGRSDLLKARCQ